MKPRRWTKQSIVEELRVLSDLSAKQNQTQRPSLYGACIRHFGSWKNAIEAAGFDYSAFARRKIPGFWTRERIVEMIRTLPERTSGDIRHKHGNLYNAALRHFGGWREAVQASGIDYDQVVKARNKKRKD